ncbi:MAG: Ca-activated chloride channel [Acidobacteriota bacterium]|jgi:VWFA-related protein|nr:Ca-activated chloride channel [Acidobacteriota bacterium]
MRRSTKIESLLCALLAALVCAVLPARVAAQTPAGKPPVREPFGSSLKRAGDEASKQGGDESRRKQEALDDGGPQPVETIKVETLLVSLDVVVTDEKESRFIAGLRAEDFQIVEDNVPQKIATLTLGDDAEKLPRSIVLVFDWSGSQRPFLEGSVKAAKTLVDQLAKTDEMAIVTDSIYLLTDFTNDKKRLKNSLDALLKQTKNGWRGQSKQFSALLATLRELINVKTRRPIIIFQTDGDESDNLKDPPGARSAAPGVYYMSDIYREVERSRAKIYTVIPGEKMFGVPDSELEARAPAMMEKVLDSWYKYNKQAPRPAVPPQVPSQVLKKFMKMYVSHQEAAARVAELSGGWAEFLEQPEQAAGIYARILSDINNRYIVGYYPTNKERGDQLRKVHIEVRNHPEYKVHGRESYYATSR